MQLLHGAFEQVIGTEKSVYNAISFLQNAHLSEMLALLGEHEPNRQLATDVIEELWYLVCII